MSTQLAQLSNALLYMNMKELRQACEQLGIPSSGKKGEIITRIVTFIKTGTVTKTPPIPTKSRAVKNVSYPLEPNTRILLGAYKNDLKTRQFFKSLIGNHFHFTAFGIDWINERWMAGNPPTYAEYATFWQQEYERRKEQKANPKKEWALINFMQRFCEQNPRASHREMLQEWKRVRLEHVHTAQKILAEHTL